MKENKNFKYKEYENCSFMVGNYPMNSDAMSIAIIDDEGIITVPTVNMPGYCYDINTATIKNYSENSGMTKFLKKLGVVKEVYSKRKANNFCSNSETIDFCEINIEKLKQYSSQFDYKY